MIKQTLILASASPRRKTLLEQIGICPQVMPSEIEEVMTGKEDPRELVMSLSEQKAADVASRCEAGTVVLGADTVVVLDGQVLGKPGSEKEAEAMITALQGRSHQVYTGVSLILAGTAQKITFAEKTEVIVFPMTGEEIKTYVKSGEPMDKAGAYGIQGSFASYIKGIEGDYNNVVGLPVGRVYQELKTLMKL